MKFFENKYRIVRDTYLGYEAQVKKWYLPFWSQIDFTNTHRTIELAEECVKKHKQGGEVVKENV